MSPELFIDLAVRTLRTALLLSAPPLLASLTVGVLISLLQSVTQMQEQTLVMVPKMLVIVIVLLLFLPWMMQTLLGFTAQLIISMPDYVR